MLATAGRGTVHRVDEQARLAALQLFVVRLGAAMNDAGEPAHSVQERLARVATANGATSARIFAFPTYLMVALGPGEPAAIELTGSLAAAWQLDQVAALDRLVDDAERGLVPPRDGIRALREIAEMPARCGTVLRILGYAVLTAGLGLILRPTPADIVAAAALGAVVGSLRLLARPLPSLQVLLPIIAAFAVSSLGAVAARNDLIHTSLPAVVASLVVFLPGATMTTAVVELASGQAVSGSSRLVAGLVQLALLALGIVAGIEAVGVPAGTLITGAGDELGAWAPWLGVVVFAVGVAIAHSAPRRAFPGLLIVLLAAWAGQIAGNELFGGYVSAFVGALVMTPVAQWVGRLPTAMPPRASFLPGFWLLVPGALGLIGLTELAQGGAAAAQDLLATAVSIFAIAVGVLAGSLLGPGATLDLTRPTGWRPRPRAGARQRCR